MPESNLRESIARLQAELAEVDMGGEFGTHRVRDYDIRILFETLRRYGGRRDWRPTEENIAALPGPVRRYILELRAQMQQVQLDAIRLVNRS